jgi:hypothetical protein
MRLARKPLPKPATRENPKPKTHNSKLKTLLCAFVAKKAVALMA